MAIKREKFFIGEIKQVDEKERTDVSIISSVSVDRDNEVILPEGCILDNFKKNPVVQYAHRYDLFPVGKALWIKIQDDKIVAKTKYANTEFANDVFNLRKEGFLNGFSVGFIPIEDTMDKKEIEEVKRKYKIEGDVQRVIKKWELLEYSICNVPANPDAIGLMVKSVKSDTMKKCLEEEKMTIEVKDICGDDELPVDEERDWDGDRAEASIRKWASSDGTGDKNKIDWDKYKRGFVWRNEEDIENFTSYKLPFAEVIDGKLTAIWRGIVAAMGALLGVRGGVDIPEDDRKQAYNFLVKYYEKVDKEPPEFHQEEEVSVEEEPVKEEPIQSEEDKLKTVKDNIQQAIGLLQQTLDILESGDTETPPQEPDQVSQEELQLQKQLQEKIQQLTEKIKQITGSVD